ncbi:MULTISPECIES: hypothetical protein [unclassified Streptomyces]|uniref:hypothetical protein n=1 Tax=unclassified Streptomyces TaxID=2593676 RepID=UPI00093DFDEF|nr:hypothetical protein [Streptomyces sp. TSRI0281]OKI34983.1 hypothetical protein A6A29_16290 [Streptomyces sp. TSRI0281]
MTPEQASAQAAPVLSSRLVRNRGLTPDEALLAVLQRRRGDTGPHIHLAAEEVNALVEEVAAPIREFAAAMAPAVEAACTAIRELLSSLQLPPAHQPVKNRRDRPAWASPYGPPPRARRREPQRAG